MLAYGAYGWDDYQSSLCGGFDNRTAHVHLKERSRATSGPAKVLRFKWESVIQHEGEVVDWGGGGDDHTCCLRLVCGFIDDEYGIFAGDGRDGNEVLVGGAVLEGEVDGVGHGGDVFLDGVAVGGLVAGCHVDCDGLVVWKEIPRWQSNTTGAWSLLVKGSKRSGIAPEIEIVVIRDASIFTPP